MESMDNGSVLSFPISNKSNNLYDNSNLVIIEGSVVYNNDDAITNKQNSISVFRISLQVICLIGIGLNLKVCFTKKQTSHRHTTKIYVRLLKFMAIADTTSLFSLLLLLCTQFFGINDEIIMHFICKVDLFLMHTASAFSIWCWLVISALRYIAIYRPYSHLTIREEPIAAVILILILCGIFESWIFYGTGFQYNTCLTMSEKISNQWASRLHILEIIWSYILPCVLIMILDVKILCFLNKLAVPLKSTSFNTSPHVETCKQSVRSASEYTISKLTITNEMSSTGRSPSTPSISDKEEKTLMKQCTLFNANQSVTYEIAMPIRTSTSYKEMPIIENPSYQEKQKEEETISKESGSKNASLGNKPTNSFELITMTPRKHTKRAYNQVRVVRRCLLITLLDLSMNLPSYLFRLYLNMISQEELEKLSAQNYKWVFNCIEDLSQFLYFAQFSLNALYLVYLVYDPPKKDQVV